MIMVMIMVMMMVMISLISVVTLPYFTPNWKFVYIRSKLYLNRRYFTRYLIPDIRGSVALVPTSSPCRPSAKSHPAPIVTISHVTPALLPPLYLRCIWSAVADDVLQTMSLMSFFFWWSLWCKLLVQVAVGESRCWRNGNTNGKIPLLLDQAAASSDYPTSATTALDHEQHIMNSISWPPYHGNNQGHCYYHWYPYHSDPGMICYEYR